VKNAIYFGFPNNALKKKKISLKNSMGIARCWRLTPVILATQEADIRRTAIQSSRQIF
jgi:hypothetical protein